MMDQGDTRLTRDTPSDCVRGTDWRADHGLLNRLSLLTYEYRGTTNLKTDWL